MEQWIILAIVGAALLGGIIFLVYKKLTRDFPVGTRTTRKYGETRIHLVTAEGSIVSDKRNKLMDAVELAVKVTLRASGSYDDFKNYVVYYVSDDYINPGYRAFSKKFDGMHGMVVSDRFLSEIIATGEPVIHEVLHATLNDYVGDPTDHEDDSVWAKFGDSTVQARARKEYKRLFDLKNM